MAGRQVGRPPDFKDREMAWGSVEAEDFAKIIALGREMGLPRSRVVGALIQYGLSHLADVDFPHGKPQHDQEELPLAQAKAS